MKLKIPFLAILLTVSLFGYSQEKQVSKVNPASSGTHSAKTEAVNDGQHKVSYDAQGRLVLTTTKSSVQHLDSDKNNSNVDTNPISTIHNAQSNVDLNSKSVEYYNGVISDLENRIATIKNNPVEYEMAMQTGKIQELELELVNAIAARNQLTKNNK